MLQVPVVKKLTVAGAVAADKIHTLGVSEVKLTANPELAVAVRGSEIPTAATAGGEKVIVCGVIPAATVNTAAGLVMPFKLAVIFVVPDVRPLAKPAALMLATAGVPEVQLAVDVTLGVVPSL